MKQLLAALLQNKLPKLRRVGRGIENLSIGAGHGIANQAEGLYQLLADPLAGTQLLEGVYQAARRPKQTLEAALLYGKKGISSPLHFGQMAGEIVDPRTLAKALAAKPAISEMTVYHGSPHKFDKFDSSKIGTGEGAQAYGHGLYLAENPRVAQEYAEKLSVNASWPGSGYRGVEKANPALLQEIMAAVGDDPLRLNRAVIKPSEFREIGPDLKKRINAFKKDYRGVVYTADIPDEHIDKMLDWDKPLSEQPENVRKFLLSDPHMGPRIQSAISGFGEAKVTGGNIFEMFRDGGFGDSTGVFENRMRDAGIPGIKYLDAGSRSAGKGSRNFVVFDDSILKILKQE